MSGRLTNEERKVLETELMAIHIAISGWRNQRHTCGIEKEREDVNLALVVTNITSLVWWLEDIGFIDRQEIEAVVREVIGQ